MKYDEIIALRRRLHSAPELGFSLEETVGIVEEVLAGLGLARAIEVARVLRRQAELAGMKVVPLSAGQLLQKGDLLSPGDGEALNDPDRRRIEIRVRRSTQEAE